MDRTTTHALPQPEAPGPGSLRHRLRAAHRRLRANGLALRLVVGSRVLLAVAFLPTGLVKLLGRPFSRIDVETPIGLFFHVMQTSGLYWQFLGATQVAAAVLLLIPATSALGAAIFFPVILNIVVITVALDFGGTVAITVPMLLAATLLVAWDYHRFEPLLVRPEGRLPVPPSATPPLTPSERIVYAAGLVSGMILFLGTRGFAPRWSFAPSLLGAALAAVAAVGLGLWTIWRNHRRG